MLPTKSWVYWKRRGAGEGANGDLAGVNPVGRRVNAAGDGTGDVLAALASIVFEKDTHRYRITIRITNNARKETSCRTIIIYIYIFL
jgi:hypothetical protein